MCIFIVNKSLNSIPLSTPLTFYVPYFFDHSLANRCSRNPYVSSTIYVFFLLSFDEIAVSSDVFAGKDQRDIFPPWLFFLYLSEFSMFETYISYDVL